VWQRFGEAGEWPRVVFTSTVFNPLVAPATGELALRLMLPRWDPAAGDSVTKALTWMKQVSAPAALLVWNSSIWQSSVVSCGGKAGYPWPDY
jgi:hypothetical protein